MSCFIEKQSSRAFQRYTTCLYYALYLRKYPFPMNIWPFAYLILVCSGRPWLLYIVACQGGGVSIKPITRTPTRHTLGPFSPLNRLTKLLLTLSQTKLHRFTKAGWVWHATIYYVNLDFWKGYGLLLKISPGLSLPSKSDNMPIPKTMGKAGMISNHCKSTRLNQNNWTANLIKSPCTWFSSDTTRSPVSKKNKNNLYILLYHLACNYYRSTNRMSRFLKDVASQLRWQ